MGRRTTPPTGGRRGSAVPRDPNYRVGSSGDGPPPARPRRRAPGGGIREQASQAVDWFADSTGPRVVFVGKLIVSKGVDLLLAAWPLVIAENPAARLLVVGFGEYRDGLERLWAALVAGDLGEARAIAAAGRGLEGGPEAPLEMLGAFVAEPGEGYVEAAAAAAGSVRLAGRLEHDEVGRLLPATEALVFPSTFPEAFGMVAAEAAAAGVLPVSADHSGLAEVSRELAGALEPDLRELVSFELGAGAVRGDRRAPRHLACDRRGYARASPRRAGRDGGAPVGMGRGCARRDRRLAGAGRRACAGSVRALVIEGI